MGSYYAGEELKRQQAQVEQVQNGRAVRPYAGARNRAALDELAKLRGDTTDGGTRRV